MDIRIIKIETKQHLDAAHAIRKKVFVEEQNVPEEAEIDKYEEEAHHFLAIDNQNKALGTARWRRTKAGVKLERFAVLREFRRMGVAGELLKYMLEDAGNPLPSGHSKFYLHSQVTAVPFYQKYGFEISGDEFDECGIRHVPMILEK